MKFVSLLDGIEAILKADANTKDVIKKYRRYIYESGIRPTPFSFIRKVRVTYRERNSKGTVWNGEVFIDFLGQAYEVPSQHLAMVEELDKLQDDAYDAFMANPQLTASVRASHISVAESVGNNEYFGFEFKMAFLVMTT